MIKQQNYFSKIHIMQHNPIQSEIVNLEEYFECL